jgi:3-methyladenine DNA glycosylase/8-oxoguanine DNA glycosylase
VRCAQRRGRYYRSAVNHELGPAAKHLVTVDPAFEAIVNATGPFEPRPPDADPFNSLARAIVFQQLAGRAARAIHGRFAALYDGHPTPDAVLDTSVEALRAVGLSANKAASLRDLAQKSTDGTVPLDHLEELEDDEIVARVSAVRGIGRWTVEMFLMFQLRRPDVWPVDDYGVRKGFAAIYKLEAPPTPKALQPLGDPYRPHRSAAAWYCWRAAETVLPQG